MSRIAMNWESVYALQQFAEAMPIAINNIVESTAELIVTYKAVSETVGPHAEEFSEMLKKVMQAQEKSNEAIAALQPLLNARAEKMAYYLSTHPDIG